MKHPHAELMTNPLETARKNLHKRYQLLAQDLRRVVSMLTLHEHTGFKTIQPAIDILQELIAGLTDVELVGMKQVEFNITGVPDLPQKDSVHSVPYYPLDGEGQVTVIGSVDNDPINPNHYKTQSGVACIMVAELLPYSLGNAIKYAWRAGKKDNLKQDLEKCEWYLNRAMANGDTVFYRLESRELTKAVALFCKLSKDDFIDERNHLLVSAIVHGNTEKALTKIDNWLKDL